MVQSKGPRGDGVQFSRLGSWKFTTSKSVTYWHFGCMPLAGRLHSDSISESVRLHECSKCSPEAPATDSENKKLEVKQHPVLGTIVPGITPQCPAFFQKHQMDMCNFLTKLPGLTEAAVASCEEVLNLVDYGTQMRRVNAQCTVGLLHVPADVALGSLANPGMSRQRRCASVTWLMCLCHRRCRG